MKINKKTIIILIVVAVVAYLLWKRSKDTVTVADAELSTGTSTANKNDLEAVIKAAFNGDPYNDIFAAKARKIYQAKTGTLTDQADYQEKANKKGYTLAQMAVIDGAFVECYTENNGKWTPKDAAHEAYFNKVVSRVREM